MDKIRPYDMPMQLLIDLASGEFAPFADFYERRLSQLAPLFGDQEAVRQILAASDPLLFDVRTRPFVTSVSDLTFTVTRIYPGTVGGEYYMTKGHFHILLEQPEIQFCLSGQGCLLLESAEGDFQAHWWTPGSLSHIAPGYAHRIANTGSEPLIFATIYHLSTGHDYSDIAKHGFSRRVVEQDGKPSLKR